jgi:hypothetical protein
MYSNTLACLTSHSYYILPAWQAHAVKKHPDNAQSSQVLTSRSSLITLEMDL